MSSLQDVEKTSKPKARRWFHVGLAATSVLAVCSFTQLLSWPMAMLGLSAYLGWLDAALLPLLGVSAALTIIAFINYRNA